MSASVRFIEPPQSEVSRGFQAVVEQMVSERVRADAERLEHDCLLAIVHTPAAYRCRLEIVQQDGIEGRRVACAWR